MHVQVNTHQSGNFRDSDLSGAVAQIEFLVKESEIKTNRPGRIFVVTGAERIAYRVFWQNEAFKVERLDNGIVIDTQYLLPKAFAKHGIVDALCAGLLITADVHPTQ
ncbi:MAG: hypothetical protein FWD67_08540 [Betaproteobacteria bacterium]|nr:hypothetical protein [Betaproteobacteria bacterium]